MWDCQEDLFTDCSYADTGKVCVDEAEGKCEDKACGVLVNLCPYPHLLPWAAGNESYEYKQLKWLFPQDCWSHSTASDEEESAKVASYKTTCMAVLGINPRAETPVMNQGTVKGQAGEHWGIL